MTPTKLALPALLCLLFCLPHPAVCGTSALAPETARGTVSWVYDGDTLEIDPIGKVRLIGIDCPEHAPAPERDRKFIALGADPAGLRLAAQAALKFNIKQAKGRVVTLADDGEHYDRHGRRLAYVRLPDDRLLNRLLLEEGLAVVYRRFDFALKQDFLEAERQAREAGKGLWAESGD